MAMWDNSFTSFSQAAGMLGDSPAGGAPRRKDQEPTLPVTPATLAPLSGIEDHIVIGTQQFNNVCCCGTIVSLDMDNMKHLYQLKDDGDEGSVLVQQYIEDRPQESYKEGDKIKVHGKLTGFNGKITITAFKVRKIESEDEIQFHRLESKTAKLFYEKDMMSKIHDEMSGSGTVTPFAQVSQAGTSGAAPLTPGVSRIANGGGYGTGAGGAAGGPLMIGGEPAHPKVQSLGMQGVNAECLQILVRHSMEKPDATQGMHLDDIKSHPLVKGRSQIEIFNALNMLTQEGHAYTTLTDEWFKVITD